MKKLLFFLFLLPSAAQGITICHDTLRVNGNGDFNNWDDANTAGCAATASNYLRVNTDATSDTIAIDTLVGICNTGSKKESHHLVNFSQSYRSIDTVRVRAKLWGTISTDSARLGMKVGTDTIWGARFALTTTPTFYDFSSHTNPHENGWEDAGVDSLQICVEGRLAVLGRIFDTEELAVICFQNVPSCPLGEGTTGGINDRFMFVQGQFAAATSTGNQTVSTGVDSVLKAIRFYGSFQTSEGFLANQSNFVGMAVSSSQQKGIAWAADDGVSTTNTGRFTADSAIMILSDGSPTVDGAAVFDSFGTGGNAGKFYINWINAPAAANLIYYEAYYGSSLTNVKVSQHTVTAAVGTIQGITGIGFQPNFVFVFASLQTARGGASHATVGFGMASAASEQATISSCAQDGDASGGYNPRFYQSDTLFLNCLTTGTSPVADNSLKFTSFDADGFSFRPRTKTTASMLFYSMCFAGGNYKVGSFDCPVAGGVPQDQSVTGLTFRPAAVSFFGNRSTTLNTATNSLQHFFGAGNDSLAAGVVSEQATWGYVENVRSPSTLTVKRNVSTKSISFSEDLFPTTDIVEADYKTQTSDGFTVTWTDINATAHKVWYIAFGPGDAPPGGTNNIRRQRLLKSKLEENEKSPVGLFTTVAP